MQHRGILRPRTLLLSVVTSLLFGCGGGDLASCDAPLATGFHECGFSYDGVNRYYQMVIPTSYTGNNAVPLVLDLHGHGSPVVGGISGEKLVSGMDKIAEREGFVVVYPQGISDAWNGELPEDTSGSDVDDYGFLLALTASLKNNLNIDDSRVYVMGISNGGAMTHILGCESSPVFAAIAPVSMQLPIAPADCNPSETLPIIAFHAPTDSLVPWAGDASLISAPASFAAWANINGCTDTPTVFYTKGNSNCSVYDSCDDSAKVAFCTIDGSSQALGGHLAYINDDSVPVAELIWQFFTQFQR